MKVSFSLSSSKPSNSTLCSSSDQNDQSEQKEFITEFDPSNTLTNSIPDDRGLGEFDDVPVEDFARAYLKGYGWCEGRGIGKNAKEDVKVVEYTNNAAGEGLGFVRTVEGDRKTVKSKTFVNNGGKD
ncbi:hypothetical protein E3N88_27066 [Mikania micrantha]|uniref:G-patch domain-containing protein n=1 Tax=Mikania micrantha TaxID=192012 RepID=A0A5N6MYG9_9ASTR|nr:hypothetical protein E3N88_27066 [Mikania micrantha]